MGETAGLVLTSGSDEAQRLAVAVRAGGWPGVEDVVPAAESLGILIDPATAAIADVLELAATLPVADVAGEVKQVDVEVCFDGPDMDAVARSVGVAVEDVIESLESEALRVAWLGFMPGFPYLVGLPSSLASVPRLDRPRVQVPAGAFAIANGHAGIYPAASPAGWNVLGRTALSMFDPERAPPATLAPGDLVRVRAVGSVGSSEVPWRAPICAVGPRRVVVLEAGAMALVQDLGRLGVAHLGVPRAGPADGLRHAIANIAVGNSERCAVLEITPGGATLSFGCDAFIALAGDCSMEIDGRATPPSTTQPVGRGETVVIGAVRTGVRAYLGISGGLEVPERLGSRSSDAVTGIWPGPLRSGDEIDLGAPGRARGRWFEPAREHPSVLFVRGGPDGGGDALAALLGSEWEVAPESNRVGTRLRPVGASALGHRIRPLDVATRGRWTTGATQAGDTEAATTGVPFPSRATVMGAIQVPPDGCPVVLGPDHGTVGGYPVVAVVTRPSLGVSGQLRPGEVVAFEESDTAAPYDVASVARSAVTGWMSGGLGA
jgi:KipI family sensor histidine kinase inhibitor